MNKILNQGEASTDLGSIFDDRHENLNQAAAVLSYCSKLEANFPQIAL